MIIYIFEKEEPGNYVVIKNNKEQASFSLECLKEFMTNYLSKITESKKVKK
jgi:hypothetical protein